MPGRADRGGKVRAGQRAGYRFEVHPPVHAAVRAGEVGGERRGQRGEESTGETGVGDVDGAGLRVGSGVVDVEVLALLAHGDLVGVDAGVTGVRGLSVEPVAPPAVRDLRQPLRHRPLAGVEHPVHHRLHRVRAVPVDQRGDPAHGHPVRRDRGAQVHVHVGRHPRLAQEHLLQVPAHLAPADQLERRERRRVGEDVGRVDAEAAHHRAADVGVVHDVGDPAEQLVADEHRRGHDRVRLVRGADVRVVGHEHVAGLDAGVLGPVLQDPLDGQRLGVGEVLQVGAEEYQVAGLGEDRGLEVPGDHRDRRDGQPLDGLPVLEVGVHQRVADDLEGHRVHVSGAGVQLQRAGDAQRLAGDVAALHAVPDRSSEPLQCVARRAGRRTVTRRAGRRR